MSLHLGMTGLESEFWRMAFLMTRTGAALLAAPVFGSIGVPMPVRVIATGAIAIFLCAWTPADAPQDIISLAGLVAILGEVILGLALGFALQIAFAAPVVAAEVIGGSMGLSMAMTSDPNGGAQVSAFGQYFSIVLTLIFLCTGGHLLFLQLVIESYNSFPPGASWLAPERFGTIAGFGGRTFATGLVIALPIALVLLLVQVLTGILSRSAPQLNLFALGLPAGVLAGLAALILSSQLLFAQLEEVVTTAIGQAAQVLQ